MIDPAEAHVEITMLVRDNEEMIGYMAPTEATRAQIKKNCARMARLALVVHSFYSQGETQLTPKQARATV